VAETKPPSARSVRAVLRNAELPEAVTQGGGPFARVVRSGWHVWLSPGEVRVRHWSVLSLSKPAERAELARYVPALEAAGWKVIEDERGGFLAVLAASPVPAETTEGNGNG
jgi:hypothetical protein